MICLTLTRDTISEGLADVRGNLASIDLVELRVDRLANPDADSVARFPGELARMTRGDTAGPACILTVRRPADGGSWSHSEAERLALLSHVLVHGEFEYVDLELDLAESAEGRALAERAESSGTRVIRSVHDFEGMPENLRGLYQELSARDGEIPKLAVTPGGSADLLALIELLLDSGPRDRIIIGMGAVGFPTRVAAPRFGGYLSYASASMNPNVAAAPGHVTPNILAETYRYREQSEATRVFGIIGNPVLHSASPEYHNRQFREKNLDALYVPFHVDDLNAFFQTASRLDIRGLSVTVPHKEAVIPHLHESDESVVPVGACNTVLFTDGRRRGINTDVPGFLLPLERAIGASGPEAFDGMRATVVGAGGAARAVVFALLRLGVRLCIVNRTPERAKRMGADIANAVGGEQPVVAALGPDAASLIEEHGTLIVQTTSVGMEPQVTADPLAFYEFRGHEIAYDLIYAPEHTRFLTRAAAAGCLIIPGTSMFEEQALAQAAHFEHVL